MNKNEIKAIAKEFLNERLSNGDKIVDWDISNNLLFGQHLVNTIVITPYHRVYKCEMWIDPIKQKVVDHLLFQRLEVK